MKYMLLIHGDQKGWDGLASWSRPDFKAMVGCMRALDADLRERGELLELNGLSGPAGATTVRAQADDTPLVRDGLRTGADDFLAGYWVVDVPSHERAVEIATRVSAVPGRGGAPVNQQVEIHPIGEPPEV